MFFVVSSSVVLIKGMDRGLGPVPKFDYALDLCVNRVVFEVGVDTQSISSNSTQLKSSFLGFIIPFCISGVIKILFFNSQPEGPPFLSC